jgi:hypothetical protein
VSTPSGADGVERQIGGDEALPLEGHLGVDGAQSLEVVGFGRQLARGLAALRSFSLLRCGLLPCLRRLARRQSREAAEVLVVEAAGNDVGADERARACVVEREVARLIRSRRPCR